MITTEDIKKLRDETGVSVMQCKKALEEAEGNMEKARILLRKNSAAIAAKKADRELGAGTVQAYIHAGGTVGAMVLLSCETDFVAKNDDFKALAREIAMQVAAINPEYLKREDVTPEAEQTAREVFAKEVADKPADMQEKILNGKLDAYFRDKVLLTQSHIKNPEQSIAQMIDAATQKFGERIEITRFTRFIA